MKLFGKRKKVLNELEVLNNKIDSLNNRNEYLINHINNLYNNLYTLTNNSASSLVNLHNQQMLAADMLEYITLPAILKHKETFSKYKDIYKGKSVVLYCTGPSSKSYIPIKDAIHVGVNFAFYNEKVKLDYLFVQDRYPTISENWEEIKNYDCKKFFGIHYWDDENKPTLAINEQDCKANNAERYYFKCITGTGRSDMCLMSPDITTRPFNTWGSTAFCALEFIMWTNPDKVYLVGCDCENTGHADKRNDEYKPSYDLNEAFDGIYHGWLMFKKFVQKHYPNTEIISINPKRLKGLFTDLYQEETDEKSVL